MTKLEARTQVVLILNGMGYPFSARMLPLPPTSALDTSDDPRVDIVMDPLVKSSTSLQRSPQSSASNRMCSLLLRL
uniref:Uncharacterized protein n=1 Tax=Acrobeloides nanus TaxID=290746 RepID=A0A914DPF8_9BILA